MTHCLIQGMFVTGFLSFCPSLLYSEQPSRPQPMAQYNHPYYDEVWGAISEDGENFTVLPGPFFRHASVPEILELNQDLKTQKAGTLLLYFVDFNERPGPGQEQVSVSSSQDGRQWGSAENISITGKPYEGAAVDPSVLQLEDGRLRMYFFGAELNALGDPASHEGPHKIYSAVSDDGLHFITEPGIRFEAQGITDPEVIFTGKEWLMFLSHGRETLLARSKDGLQFTQDETVYFQEGGVPGAVVLPDGKIRVFLSRFGNIFHIVWNPDSLLYDSTSLTQTLDKGSGLMVADPACILRSDGTYFLIFKYKNVES